MFLGCDYLQFLGNRTGAKMSLSICAPPPILLDVHHPAYQEDDLFPLFQLSIHSSIVFIFILYNYILIHLKNYIAKISTFMAQVRLLDGPALWGPLDMMTASFICCVCLMIMVVLSALALGESFEGEEGVFDLPWQDVDYILLMRSNACGMLTNSAVRMELRG